MISREEAKSAMNVVKYGMVYSPIEGGSFTGHENFIDKLFDSFEKEINDLKDRNCESCQFSTNISCGLCECTNDDSFFYSMELPVTTYCDQYKKGKQC